MEGGQIMVVCIVALVMLAGIIKSAVGENPGCGRGKKRNRPHASHADSANLSEDILIKMNAQLDRITERLNALETIVTDEDRELKRQFKDLRSDVSHVKRTVDTDPQ